MVDPVWATPIKSPSSAPPNAPILISLRPSKHLDTAFLTQLAEYIANLSSEKNNASILLVAAQAEEDLPVLENFKKILSKLTPNLSIEISEQINPQHFTQCQAVIAMRLHVLLMALKHHKPCLGVAYDPKVVHLCQVTQTPMTNLMTWTTKHQPPLPRLGLNIEAISSQNQQAFNSYNQLVEWLQKS